MRLLDQITEKCEPYSYTDLWRQALGTAPRVGGIVGYLDEFHRRVGREVGELAVGDPWRLGLLRNSCHGPQVGAVSGLVRIGSFMVMLG